VYDRAWSSVTVLARGLVLDLADRIVVATPFPKFFNFGEGGYALPEGEFEAFEKLDGSLIIVFHHGGRWWAVTKGDFHATQAAWALNVLTANPAVAHLDTSKTWLFEAVGPQNRIVVPYGEPALVLLAAFDHQGVELAYGTVQEVADQIGVRAAERHHFARLADLVAYADGLPRTREGFVVRYRNGTRLKIKGAEYRRIHALISRVTPLAIWEAMAAGDDLDSFRRDIPEEFWTDFDAIRNALDDAYAASLASGRAAAASVAHLSDKELGLSLHQVPADVRPHVFALRKAAGGPVPDKLRAVLLRGIRPTGNVLAGYKASYAVARLQDDV
jgi:RNA ligase